MGVRQTCSIESIVSEVSHYFGIPGYDILSERQSAALVEARHCAMWLARHLTPYSYPRIGRAFDRDHTTVMHGVRKVERRKSVDDGLRAELENLLEICEREAAA